MSLMSLKEINYGTSDAELPAICDLFREDYLKLRATAREYWKLREIFKHRHVNRADGTDACRECGLDLRDMIHVRTEET